MKMPGAVVLGGLLWLAAAAPLCVSEDVVVNTTYGAVKGTRVSKGQSGYMDTFFGIPYAQPPVGPLRFKAPLPAAAWTGTRDASQFSSVCPQPLVEDFPTSLFNNEDCLYLNVYSPKPPSDNAALPVMVWIHGGSYKTGSGAFYNGSELAKRGVVVVTINYRLDALGFLSTLDAASPGNNGLLDQILALKWVKDTIASFHGDPNDVTIFGESAGSSSVSLLTLSPLAQGLFSKAIMESGVSLCAWAVASSKDATSPLQWAHTLAAGVGCGADADHDNVALVDCLRNVSVDAILNATKAISLGADTLVFRPTVETEVGVIPEEPLRLLLRGAGSNIAAIRGLNKDESSLFYLNLPLAYFSLTNTKAQILHFAQVHFPNDAQAVADKLTAEYITSRGYTTPEQCRTATMELLTDFDFVVPIILEQQHSVARARHAKQFLYHFTYRATHSTQPAWAGVTHASEMAFVFGQPFTNDRFFSVYYSFSWSPDDMTVSLNTMTLWTNFAKYGNPTPQAVGGAEWSPFSLANQTYLEIGSTLTGRTDLMARRVRFWGSILDHLGGLVG